MSRVRRVFVSLVLAATFVGCLEVPPPKDPYAPRDVTTPDGSALSEACTPSGVEMCFDAVDNNCNGVIDEGCGLHTGILQFAAAWDAEEADVDLEVTDASGELAQAGETTKGGLLKERDCPQDSGQCQGQNIENVYLVGGEPERGRYRAVVKLDKLGGASSPVKVRLGVRIGQRAYSMTFDLSPGDKTSEKAFEFTL
ncbi:MAG TPA: MopE-related protein [Polyangiaceae bacterium]|jgi:tRNA (guanosine-2'-O-)-methyltransferase|nr:MopE-related protein [Polyangiaceae bacterium]